MFASFPLRILHNSEERSDFPHILASDIPNVFEADCWYHQGRLEVHHHRRIWKTPLMVTRWLVYVRLRRTRLEDFFQKTSPATLVKIDLKHRIGLQTGGLLKALTEFFDTHPPWRKRCFAVLSYQNTRLAHDLARYLPFLPVFWSVGSLQDLEAFRWLLFRDVRLAGLSVNPEFFLGHQEAFRGFMEQGFLIDAAVVNDPALADKLLDLGAQAITSDQLDTLRILKNRA